MKKVMSLIGMLILAGTGVASACPNLAGNYECGGKGILLSVSDLGSSFNFSLVAPFSSNPGAFQGGSYSLSKTGGQTSSMEGIGYRHLDVVTVCEGTKDLKLDGVINDPIAGPTHVTKRIFKDLQGNLRKSTVFIFANGSTRNGDDEFCGARFFRH